MVIVENIRSGFSEIWGHKLRSALTLVGIFLGTLSITFMFSLVQGVRVTIAGVFETIGFDGALWLEPRQLERGERDAWNLASSGITLADAAVLRERLDGRALVSPVVGGGQVVERDGKRTSVEMLGINEDFFDIRNFEVEHGRPILATDVEGATPVIVLGPEVAKDLFGKAERAVGEELELGGLRFRVVGVVKKLELPPGMGGGGAGGMFGWNTIYMPITAGKVYFFGSQPVVSIALKAPPGSDFAAIAEEAQMLIAARHRGVRDFEVENIAEEMLREREEVDDMLFNFSVILGSIAGAALLVGGIGILSLMLIAVHERLFEIGIRKAVGATDTEILVQFLVESTALSVVGAGAGIAAAVAFVMALSPFFPFGLSVSGGGLSLSSFFAVSTGLGFGLYPAWLASRKDPVESLRAA